jgi:ABC-type sugar transport system, permease component
VQAWNEYIYALTFLNSRDKLTLPVGLQRFFTEYATDWPGLMAAAFIMSVPWWYCSWSCSDISCVPSPKER